MERISDISGLRKVETTLEDVLYVLRLTDMPQAEAEGTIQGYQQGGPPLPVIFMKVLRDNGWKV